MQAHASLLQSPRRSSSSCFTRRHPIDMLASDRPLSPSSAASSSGDPLSAGARTTRIVRSCVLETETCEDDDRVNTRYYLRVSLLGRLAGTCLTCSATDRLAHRPVNSGRTTSPLPDAPLPPPRLRDLYPAAFHFAFFVLHRRTRSRQQAWADEWQRGERGGCVLDSGKADRRDLPQHDTKY